MASTPGIEPVPICSKARVFISPLSSESTSESESEQSGYVESGVEVLFVPGEKCHENQLLKQHEAL